MKNKITLIGRGWLGDPLFHSLEKMNYEIFSTTTKSSNGDLNFDITSNEFPAELKINDILIYTIPPLGKNEVESFFSKIDINQKIIFISSTSVYEKNLGSIDETFLLSDKNCHSPILFQSEQFLKKRFKNLTILRPGGLYGLKRHPVYHLSGKKDLTTGEERLHLVHLDDCIKVITALLEKNIWGEDFNVVSDLRIKKSEYYTEMCKKLSLIPPTYSMKELLTPTNISNQKIKAITQVNFLNPLDFYLKEENK